MLEAGGKGRAGFPLPVRYAPQQCTGRGARECRPWERTLPWEVFSTVVGACRTCHFAGQSRLDFIGERRRSKCVQLKRRRRSRDGYITVAA